MAAESGAASSRGTSTGSKSPPVFTRVEELRPDTRGHNLIVKVVASTLVLNKQGGRGTNTRIAEVLLGDATGVIVFSAKNEQVDVLAPGKYAVLRNARIDMFKGSMRLVVDQWGKVEPLEEQPQPTFATKEDNNLSLIEYELVRIPEGAAAAAVAATPCEA